MAIDVFGLYEELCGAVNTQQGGHVRPNRNFIQWVNAISLSLFEEKFAAWEKSQKIVDDLSKPFLKSINIQVNQAGGNYGIAQFPDNYGHYSSVRYFRSGNDIVPKNGLDIYDCCGKKIREEDGCPSFINPELWEAMKSQKDAEEPKIDSPKTKEVPVDMIPNDRWTAAMSHRFNGPTMSNPKMTQFEGGFKIAPEGVTMIVLDYLRIPADATFEYTVVPGDPLTGAGDYLVYDPIKSNPLEWSSLIKNEIVTRLEKKYGKYIREDFIWQTSESDRKQTV